MNIQNKSFLGAFGGQRHGGHGFHGSGDMAGLLPWIRQCLRGILAFTAGDLFIFVYLLKNSHRPEPSYGRSQDSVSLGGTNPPSLH